MIIDSIEHVILPTESQVAQLDEASVDQAVLFTTTPHPERAAAATLKDIESEMTVLYKILGATMDIATRSSQMVGIIEEMRRAMGAYPDRFPAAFGPVPLGLDQPHTHEWVERHVLTNGFVGLGESLPETTSRCAASRSWLPSLRSAADFHSGCARSPPSQDGGYGRLATLPSVTRTYPSYSGTAGDTAGWTPWPSYVTTRTLGLTSRLCSARFRHASR